MSVTKNSHSPSLLDYDYVFENGSESDEYSVLVYPNFSDSSLEDKSVSYTLSEDLKAIIAPHHYDENGYPVYQDIEKDESDNIISVRDCVRVCGYRKKGDVTLSIISNSDPTLSIDVPLTVGEALPTSMTINVNEKESAWVNEPKSITATFGPKNVNDKRLHVELNDNSFGEITNNDNSSVIITGKKKGKTTVTVTSVANSELHYEFELEFKVKDKINPSNYESFHKLIRKGIGHFSLFLLTSVFGFAFFYTLIDERKKIWQVLLLTLGCGLFLAAVSEFIQYFIPGRSGIVADALIDFMGYGAGTFAAILVVLLIWLIKYLANKNKNINETNK